MSQLPDRDLLREYCQGDRAAFDALFARYAARVQATALRLTANWEDAEEVLQDVFVRLARAASTIRSGNALATWIYRTTANRATDALRRRRPESSLDVSEERHVRVIAMESLRREAFRGRQRQRDSLLEQIEALIPRLPPRQSQVLVLRGFQGLSHREIGDALGVSEASSKSHYSHACRKLRQWVRDASAKRPVVQTVVEG